MGGKPNPGTPPDRRLSDNQNSNRGTRVTRDGGNGGGNSVGSTGNTQGYNTYMPWARR